MLGKSGTKICNFCIYIISVFAWMQAKKVLKWNYLLKTSGAVCIKHTAPEVIYGVYI